MAFGGLTQLRHNSPVSEALMALDKLDKLFRFVTFNASGELVRAGAGDAAYVLVAEEDEQGGTYVIGGKEKILAAANIDTGDLVTSDNEGRAVVATAGDAVNGVALQDIASGDRGTILVAPVPMEVPA